MKRRNFLQQISLFTGASLLPVGVNSWVARGVAQTNNNKRLIVVFLRGAVDGLNVVVPYQETAYYEARPTIALPPPGKEKGVIDLDGYFGLHPALAPLVPLWKAGNLAFVHASGSPDPTRSHFEAQDYMETGTPGSKKTTDGWLNRLLAIIPRGTPVQALNLGNTTPRILEGSQTVANLPRGRNATRPLPIERPVINAAFDRLYSGNDALSLAYQEGEAAREILLAELQEEMMKSNRGAPPPANFASDARKVAKLMVGDSKTQIAFMALGGWDTHVNQNPKLNRHLKSLGQGLAALVKELGVVFQDTVIVVMSEFGRTVKENGNLGTDHGHGNAIWLLGGGIRGQKIYGEWPGLETSALFQERDLAVTTDFREVISALLVRHLQIAPTNLKQVFPGYVYGSLSILQ